MGERKLEYWIVNGITVSRSLLSLAAVSMIATRESNLMAAGLFTIIAAVSLDLIDGKLARHWGVQSQEGGYRDALADVTMVTAGLLGVGIAMEQFPALCWLTISGLLIPWFTFVRWQQVRN